MPTYIALLKWTQQGISQVKESPDRLTAGKEAFRSAGIEFKDFYMTMGRYDMICILEAPDDETLARGMLNLRSQGSVSSETLRAFPEDQYRKILDAL